MNKKFITFILLIGLVAGIVYAGNWAFYNLPSVTIPKNSADGTKIYDYIGTWCLYPSSLTASTHNEFQLYFVSNTHLRIRNIQQDYIGSQQVTLYCNGDANTFTLNIVNQNPVITTTPATAVVIEQPYTYDVDAVDPDGDTVSFSLLQGPTGMTIQTVSGIISWAPQEADIGNHVVSVKASDVFGGASVQTYTLTVNDKVRNPPVFTSTPVTTAKIGNIYVYDADASDADGDVLTYSLSTAPTGMTINSATGVVIWTASSSQAGTHQIQVDVTDSRFTASQQYVISVDSGVDVAINAEPVSGIVPLTVRFSPVINTGDGPFTVYWDFENDGVVDEQQTITNPSLSHFVFNTYKEGTFTATLTVVDAQGDTGTATVTINSNPTPEYIARRMIHVDRLRTIGEYFRAGDQVQVFVNFKNDDNYDMKHVKVTSLISELGVRKAVGPFKLDRDEEITRKILLELPADTAPGVYNIRTTISNYGGIKRIKYRTIIVQ